MSDVLLGRDVVVVTRPEVPYPVAAVGMLDEVTARGIRVALYSYLYGTYDAHTVFIPWASIAAVYEKHPERTDEQWHEFVGMIQEKAGAARTERRNDASR